MLTMNRGQQSLVYDMELLFTQDKCQPFYVGFVATYIALE